MGGIAGALLDRHNPWRGGVIGGALGAAAGGTLTEISARAAREAHASGRPVEYRTEDRIRKEILNLCKSVYPEVTIKRKGEE